MPDAPLTEPETQSAERIERQVRRLLWSRYSIIAVFISVLAFFGAKEIFRSATESEIKAAQRAAILAEEKAKTATENALKLSDAYAKNVGALQDQAVTVQDQFSALAQRLKAESSNLRARADNSQAALNARLAKLEELVERVAKDAQTSRQVLEAYRSEVEKLKTTAAEQARLFGANGEYTVSILYFPGKREVADKAQDILSKVGFKTATANLPANLPPGGASVPTGDVMRYTEGAAHKATEIRDLLSGLVKFRTVDQIRSPLEYEKWSLVPFGGFTSANRIVIYLSL